MTKLSYNPQPYVMFYLRLIFCWSMPHITLSIRMAMSSILLKANNSVSFRHCFKRNFSFPLQLFRSWMALGSLHCLLRCGTIKVVWLMWSHLNELIPHSRHVELVEDLGIRVLERAESQRQLGSVEDRRVTLLDSLLKLVKNAIVSSSVVAHRFEKPHLRCKERQDAKRIDLLAWRLWNRAHNVDNNDEHRKTLHHCKEAESQLAESLKCKSSSSKCCWIKNSRSHVHRLQLG